MENKQKPSLFLVGNHLKLEESGIPFTDIMLTWPVVSFVEYPEPCTNVERNISLRNALSALSKLHPFQAKISVTAEVENERLSYENRTWGKIFLNEESIVTFSHHSTDEKKSLSNIEDWVEDERINPKDVLVTLAKWSIEDWVKFFKEKIIARAMHLKSKAKNKRGDADELEKSADTILVSIAKTSLN